MAELSTLALASDANLTHYYRFESNSNDSKGSDNGTDTSITYAAGKYTNAAVFNASSDQIAYGVKLMPVGARSISFWVKTSTTPGDLAKIYDDAAHSSTSSGSSIDINSSGKIEWWSFKTTAGVPRWDKASTAGVVDGNWHHVCLTWDGSTNAGKVKIYIDNGTPDTATAASSDAAATNNSLLGSYNAIFELDDLCIFNRELSAAEVAVLYAAPVSATGMLMFFR